MTKFTLSALILGFFCFSNLYAESKTNINFQNHTLSGAQSLTAQQQKHFLAYIHGDRSLSCQIIEEAIFTDPKFGQYINDEFLALKVDIHSALGKEWDDEFQIITAQSQNTASISYHNTSNRTTYSEISALSLELCDSNKQEVIKQHIKQLELLLQKNESLVDQTAEADQAGASCQELFSNTEEIRNLIDALKAIESVQNSEIPLLKEAVVAATVPFERQASTTSIDFIITNSSIKKLYSKGSHKVQLGQYTDYNEAAALIKSVESTFEAKKAFLLIDKKGDYTTYRVLVKGFENQKEANDFIVALKEMGFDL